MNPETVFQSQESLKEIHDDSLDYYKVDIVALEFLSCEPCNMSCRFGKSCSTVTTVIMKMKQGASKFPDNEFSFCDLKTFSVAFPSLGLIT